MASYFRQTGKRRGRPAEFQRGESYCLDCGQAGKLRLYVHGVCAGCREKRLQACVVYDRAQGYGEIPLNLLRGES